MKFLGGKLAGLNEVRVAVGREPTPKFAFTEKRRSRSAEGSGEKMMSFI